MPSPLTTIPATGLEANLVSTITQGVGPKITTITYAGDDTAALPAGGQTITINGSGFKNTSTVYIDGAVVGVVSFIDANTLTFVAPAKAASNYSLYVVNVDGATAISVPGITYSNAPVWSTSSGSVGSPYEANTFNVSLSATGDGSVTYAMAAGNSLPSGLTLASNGYISGTVPATDPTTTYTFYVDAIDSQNQETTRSFSITYNKDAVTWSSPANGTAYSLFTGTANTISLSATSASGRGITYSVQSGSLPANLSISGSSITGTPNTAQVNTSVTIRATVAAASRVADLVLYFLTQADPQRFSNFNISDSNAQIQAGEFEVDSGVNFCYGALRYGSNRSLAIFKYNLDTQSVVWAKDINVSGLLSYYTGSMSIGNGKLFIPIGVDSPEYNIIMLALLTSDGNIVWKKLYDSEDYSVSGSTDAPSSYQKSVIFNSNSNTVWFAQNGGNDAGWLVLNESTGSLASPQYAFYSTFSGGTNADIYGGFISGNTITSYHNPNAGDPAYVIANTSWATSPTARRLTYSGSLYHESAFLNNNGDFVGVVIKYSNGPILNSASQKEYCITTPTGSNTFWFTPAVANGKSYSFVRRVVDYDGSYYVFGSHDFGGSAEYKNSPFLIKFTNKTVSWAVRFRQDNNIPEIYPTVAAATVSGNKCYFSFYQNIFTYPTAGGITGTLTAGGITYTIENITISTSNAEVTSSSIGAGLYTDSGGKTFSDASGLSISNKNITLTSNTY